MERQPKPKSKSRIVPMRFAVLALACLLVAAAWGANRSAKRSAKSVVVIALIPLPKSAASPPASSAASFSSAARTVGLP